MKMVLGRGKIGSTPHRDEVVEHWCLEPACQSDPDAATNSHSVAPGSLGAAEKIVYPSVVLRCGAPCRGPSPERGGLPRFRFAPRRRRGLGSVVHNNHHVTLF